MTNGMSNFTENALIKKLLDLNASQQSIQTLSLWLIHHRKHHQVIVKLWYREFIKAKQSKKLTFLYLANDVIQNSKKKGPEYTKEFGNVLKKSLEHMCSVGYDDKTKNSLLRVLSIWGERGVYEQQQIDDFKRALGVTSESTSKKTKIENDKTTVKRKNLLQRRTSEKEVTVEVDGTVETHITLSPRTPAGDPPEPDELIKALQDLDNSASSDAAVREKIASLPPDVSEVSLLTKIEDKDQAEVLSKKVSDAVNLLTDYNLRLSSEMENRKKVTVMLKDFLETQKELVLQAEQRLEEYSDKLTKMYAVRQEVKSHIQNLPDLSQLPDVTGGLAPLPSAGDLFSLQ